MKQKEIKVLCLKTIHHLSTAFQKSMTYKLTMQLVEKNPEKQQAACGIITDMNPAILSSNSESFKYKTSITGNTYNAGDGEDDYDANKVGKNKTEVVIPLKHLSNFWMRRALNIPLINCKVELILAWSKNCVLADMTARNAGNSNDPPAMLHQLD